MKQTTMDYNEHYTSLTGLAPIEILGKFNEVLPPDGYREIKGGANLTDIAPPYLVKVPHRVVWHVGYWVGHEL